jgi:hypothetical protein
VARIELPDGAWADVRDDIGKAPRRLTKAIGAAQIAMAALPSFAAIRNAAKTADTTDIENAASNLSQNMSAEDIPLMMPLMDRMKEAQVLALVTAWSFDLPITAESLDELPEDAFDVLAAEAEKRTAAAATKKADLLDPTQLPVVSNA